MNVIYIYFMFLLFLASINDYLYHEIPDEISLLVLIISISNPLFFSRIIPSLSVFIILLIIAIKTNGKIGGGDIKLFTVSCLFLGLTNFSMFFLISLVITLILIIIYKRKNNVKDNNFGFPLAIGMFLSGIPCIFLI